LECIHLDEDRRRKIEQKVLLTTTKKVISWDFGFKDLYTKSDQVLITTIDHSLLEVRVWEDLIGLSN